MISPSVLPPSLQSNIPKLKIKRFPEALHLGDSMKIVAVHEKGYMAQLNGSGVELLLIQGFDTSSTSDESPPPTSRSLPPPTSSRRSSSLPSPSRSQGFSSHSRRSLDGLDLGDMRLSPRTSSSPSLTTLCPRNKARRMAAKADDAKTSSPRSPRSNPTSPRASSSLSNHILSPPNPPHNRSPPRQRRSNGLKPLVQRSPSYTYYPVQGWVLWRRTIGQWERVWMVSKKSPTRICFYNSENEDIEEREAIRVEDFRSLWAPDEESTKGKLSQSIHFRLFTAKKTIYLIVPTTEKMRYWIAGLRKLNPDMEIDARDTMDPASPLSPRSASKLIDSSSIAGEDSYGTDDEMDGWD